MKNLSSFTHPIYRFRHIHIVAVVATQKWNSTFHTELPFGFQAYKRTQMYDKSNPWVYVLYSKSSEAIR